MPNDKVPENLFKFDVYDIFGYLVPGAIFIIGVYVHANMFKMENLLNKLKETFSYLNPFSDPWPEFLTATTLFLFLAYIVGHLLALFSAAIMDKWVVERIFGFPHERLFRNYLYFTPNKETNPELDFYRAYKRQKQHFYKAMMGVFIFTVICIALFKEFNITIVDKITGWGFLLGSAVLIILIVLKILFTIANQNDIRVPYDIKKPDDKYRVAAQRIWDKFLGYLIIKLAHWSFEWWAYSLLSLFRLCKPFHPEFQDKFITQFKNTFKIEKPGELGTDIFWLTYAYVCQNDPASAKLIQRWLCHYGFARNLAVSFFVLFLYGIILERWSPTCNYHTKGYEYLSWCLITGIPAVVFGLRYYYIYYNYYSKFVFRAFVSAV